MSIEPIQHLHDLEHLVGDLVDLNDQIAQLTERAAGIKAQLAERIGVGASVEVGEVTVTVRGPSRSFDLEAAWAALTPEQQALAVERSAKKVKSFLPPVIAEEFMRPGTGNPIVTVK